MRVRKIDQAVSDDCLFNVLAQWLTKPDAAAKCTVRMLSAFASGKAIGVLEPMIDTFLAHDNGNTVEVIVGLDRGVTDRAALEKLHGLADTYHMRFVPFVFRAQARNAIFHPKLFLWQSPKSREAVVGSANLTAGGLAANFESLVHASDLRAKGEFWKAVLGVWNTYRTPQPPLRRNFLIPLTASALPKLVKSLPKRAAAIGTQEAIAAADLWKPLSRLRIGPNQDKIVRRKAPVVAKGKRYLLTDILLETRSTQVQFRMDVLDRFFRHDRETERSIRTQVITPTGLSQPVVRPIVHSGRSMRRIEIPEIRFLDRPLLALFLKLKGRERIAYLLVKRSDAAFGRLGKLLERANDPESGTRRYHIGTIADPTWKRIEGLVGAKWKGRLSLK